MSKSKLFPSDKERNFFLLFFTGCCPNALRGQRNSNGLKHQHFCEQMEVRGMNCTDKNKKAKRNAFAIPTQTNSTFLYMTRQTRPIFVFVLQAIAHMGCAEILTLRARDRACKQYEKVLHSQRRTFVPA